jgi:hypothetical protein
MSAVLRVEITVSPVADFRSQTDLDPWTSQCRSLRDLGEI